MQCQKCFYLLFTQLIGLLYLKRNNIRHHYYYYKAHKITIKPRLILTENFMSLSAFILISTAWAWHYNLSFLEYVRQYDQPHNHCGVSLRAPYWSLYIFLQSSEQTHQRTKQYEDTTLELCSTSYTYCKEKWLFFLIVNRKRLFLISILDCLTEDLYRLTTIYNTRLEILGLAKELLIKHFWYFFYVSMCHIMREVAGGFTLFSVNFTLWNQWYLQTRRHFIYV